MATPSETPSDSETPSGESTPTPAADAQDPGKPPGVLSRAGSSGSRVNVASLLTGFALGAVLATMAWVQMPQGGGPQGTPQLVSLGNGDGGAVGESGEGLTFEDESGQTLTFDPDEGLVAQDDGTQSGGQSDGQSGASGDGEAAGDDPASDGSDSSGTAQGGVSLGGGDGGEGGGSVFGGGGTTGGSDGGTTGGSTGGSTGGTTGGSGGGTSIGVSDSEILLGATYVDEGIAKDFLGEARIGMNAVRDRVNSQGGVAGRTLNIKYRGDGWQADRGLNRIQTLVKQDKVFALAVSPSSEGLNAASNTGFLADNRVPVVGADGLNNSQFITPDGKPNPWIWPVASATTTQMHIIMQDAKNRCDKDPDCDKLRPAIVFGNTYRFGLEGAYAFNQAYNELTGENIPGYEKGRRDCRQNSRFCGIEAGSGGKQYTSEINTINSACDNPTIGGGECNFLMLLLEPKTAQDWMGSAREASYWSNSGNCCGQVGAQPLFTRDFAVECGRQCDSMIVWTGYNPPIGDYENRAAVKKYVDELERTDSTADRFNQFTLGAYIGMELLVAALDEVGRDLTRERLVHALNNMPALDTGLTKPGGLKWTTQQRYANNAAQAFRISHGAERFDGFELVSDYIDDPWTGQHNHNTGY